MVKRTIISLLILVSLMVSAVPAFAYSGTTSGNPATWSDNSKMYCDIWVGMGPNFGVSGSTWFVPSGTKQNTKIYNRTSLSITGVGVSVAGLGLQSGSTQTYNEMTNTWGQNWAGISGTVSEGLNYVLMFYMTGNSSGTVTYDGSFRSSSASCTKFI